MKTLITVTLVLFTAMSFASFQNDSYLKEVKSGNKDLYCHIGKTEKWIDPELVSGYDDHAGWKFTNGSAKNCTLIAKS